MKSKADKWIQRWFQGEELRLPLTLPNLLELRKRLTVQKDGELVIPSIDALLPKPGERFGHWMQTYTGRAFYLFDPRAEDVCIEDIAHGLAFSCRFNGQCRGFYSIAQHSWLMADYMAAQGASGHDCLATLLHDSPEAYIGDMIWPLKQVLKSHGFGEVEEEAEAVIYKVFGITMTEELARRVKDVDLMALATEKRDLMVPGPGREDGAAREAKAAGSWHCDVHVPFPATIVTVGPEEAERTFLERFARYS